MKKCIYIIIALAFVLPATSSNAQIPASGLVAHWPFTGNANDVAGNNHDGIIHNVTSVAGELGAPNTAYLFNTANSYISIPPHSDFNLNYISLCAVVKPNVFYSGPCEGNYILSRGSVTISATSGSFCLGYFENAYNNCNILDTNLEVATGHVSAVGVAPALWASPVKLHTGNWYCMVLTFDGTYCRIYINGILAVTTTGWASTVGNSTDSISIGKYLLGGSTYPYNFNGVIDDVAIYNRPLTATEAISYCNSVAILDTTVYISQQPLDTAYCTRDTFHLKYQTTLQFNSGNVFTAQLSDGSGSFTTPINIGTVASTSAGTIICTIPNGTPTGTGYRVRIVSSSPVRTSVSNTKDLTVKPVAANINATNNGPVCAGSTLSLSGGTTSTGVSFFWTGPNAFTSTAQNPNITNAQTNATGNYIIRYTLAGCSAFDTTAALINPTPATPVAGANSPVCTGATLNLTASTVAGATYSWTGPNGYTSAAQNPSFIVSGISTAGKYYVQAVINGCYSAKDSITVAVNQGPSVNIYPSPNDSICVGSNITFVAIPNSAGTNPQYKWYRNNVQIPGAISTSYSTTGINDGDIIYCILSANGVCSSLTIDTSNMIQVTVLPRLTPSVSIAANPSTPLSPYQLVTFTATPVNGGLYPKYQWKRNGADVQGATSFTWGTYQLSDNDSISVVLTSSYLCSQPAEANSNIVKVQVLTGVDGIENSKNISLYPNPNKGSFTIAGNLAHTGDIQIEVFDALGRLVFSASRIIKTTELNEQIQLDNLSEGVYVLKIKVDNEIKLLHFAVSK